MSDCPQPDICRASSCWVCEIGHVAGCRCGDCDEDRAYDAARDYQLEEME